MVCVGLCECVFVHFEVCVHTYCTIHSSRGEMGWRRDICIKDSKRIVVLVGGWLARPLKRVGEGGFWVVSQVVSEVWPAQSRTTQSLVAFSTLVPPVTLN